MSETITPEWEADVKAALPTLVPIVQTAEFLHMKPRNIYRKLALGELEGVRRGRGTGRFVTRASIIRLLRGVL